MFVFKSKYDKLLSQLSYEQRRADELPIAYEEEVLKYKRLRKAWDSLVNEVNSKGGQKLLDEAGMPDKNPNLSQDLIKKMLQLCHPDKHQGKQIAVEVTQMLLKMKGKK